LHNLSLAEAEKLAEFVIAEDDGALGLGVGHNEAPICNNQPVIFLSRLTTLPAYSAPWMQN